MLTENLPLNLMLRDFLSGIDLGITSISPYDVMWVAMIPDRTNKPYFRRWVHWIFNYQNYDGSWGLFVDTVKSRVLTTMAALLFFKRYPRYARRHTSMINRAISFLTDQKTIMKAIQDPIEPVGYELIFPSLVHQIYENYADSFTNFFPDSYIRIFEKQQEKKLNQLLTHANLFNDGSPISYSAEFLHDNVDFRNLIKLQNSIGAFGNSPSATAFFLIKAVDFKKKHQFADSRVAIAKNLAFRYIRWLLMTIGYPAKIFPFDVSSAAWSVLSLVPSNYGKVLAMNDGYYLFNMYSLSKNGHLSYASTLRIYDLDDTLATYIGLKLLGFPNVPKPDISVFEEESYFKTFVVEKEPSLSVNIRVLWASFLAKDEIWFEKSFSFIKNRSLDFNNPQAWYDKWMASPFYNLTHLCYALSYAEDKDLWPEVLDKISAWLEKNQHLDGSFGIFGYPPFHGSTEESVYALTISSLLRKHWHIYPNIDYKALKEYIINQFTRYYPNEFHNQNPHLHHPPFWIGKAGMYFIKRVLLAAAIGSFFLDYEASKYK